MYRKLALVFLINLGKKDSNNKIIIYYFLIEKMLQFTPKEIKCQIFKIKSKIRGAQSTVVYMQKIIRVFDHLKYFIKSKKLKIATLRM